MRLPDRSRQVLQPAGEGRDGAAAQVIARLKRLRRDLRRLFAGRAATLSAKPDSGADEQE